MSRLVVVAISLLLALSGGCITQHAVHLEPIHIEPIHVRMDVNVRLDDVSREDAGSADSPESSSNASTAGGEIESPPSESRSP